jgi:RNA polymerase sigma-70 factor (ECF subfamily)
VGPSDAELVARVLASDDRHAFATLVRRHQAPVRALLRRLTCGDGDLADDLVKSYILGAKQKLRDALSNSQVLVAGGRAP